MIDIRRVIKKVWKTALLFLFGISFIKDLILIAFVTGLMVLGFNPLLVAVITAGISLVLNWFGYLLTT